MRTVLAGPGLLGLPGGLRGQVEAGEAEPGEPGAAGEGDGSLRGGRAAVSWLLLCVGAGRCPAAGRLLPGSPHKALCRVLWF